MTFRYRAFFHIFMANPCKNDIGCLIPDIWVSSFFSHFHGKIHLKMTPEASFVTFGYRAFFGISMKNDVDASFVTFGYRAFFDISMGKIHIKMISDP